MNLQPPPFFQTLRAVPTAIKRSFPSAFKRPPRKRKYDVARKLTKKERDRGRNGFACEERRRRSQRGLMKRRKHHWEETTRFYPYSCGSSAPLARWSRRARSSAPLRASVGAVTSLAVRARPGRRICSPEPPCSLVRAVACVHRSSDLARRARLSTPPCPR